MLDGSAGNSATNVNMRFSGSLVVLITVMAFLLLLSVAERCDVPVQSKAVHSPRAAMRPFAPWLGCDARSVLFLGALLSQAPPVQAQQRVFAPRQSSCRSAERA